MNKVDDFQTRYTSIHIIAKCCNMQLFHIDALFLEIILCKNQSKPLNILHQDVYICSTVLFIPFFLYSF